MIDQPPPTPNHLQPVWSLVIADMQERDRVGRERYGTPLQPFNGRDALADAYAECLDMAVYLRQEMIERETAQRGYFAGFFAGIEAAAKLIDGWHIHKGGYCELAHVVRALVAPVTDQLPRET